MLRGVLAGALLLLAALPSRAAGTPPEFGRYLPKYPAIYYNVGFLHDARNASFDARGNLRNSATPTVPGRTSYPETRFEVGFTSYFPWFEDAGIPWLSETTHLARATLRYGETEAKGPIRDFVSTNPDFAPETRGRAKGIGDVSFEVGSFLFGASDWRTRKDTPFAGVILFGFDAPVGDYEETSPINQGTNRFAWGATLGVHWRPWYGAFVEAGGGLRRYAQNHNPHFGRLSPARQGDDRLLNLSFSHRLFRGAFLGAFVTDRRGDPNLYRDPFYAPNAPEPDPAPEGGTTESFPIPGNNFTDDGTALRVLGFQASYFITPRLSVAVDYQHPLSGRSGQFLVPFRQRQCPALSQPGASSCTESDFPEPTLVDGQGAARSYGSNSFHVSIGYNFGHADLYSCTGCKQ